MSGPSADLERIEAWLRPHGLIPRGVICFADGEGPALSAGGKASTVVLVGHAGSSLWPAFAAWRAGQSDGGGADPLDNWSKAVIGPLAQSLGATAYYPSEEPYQPFQRWAMAAEGLFPSPLGILIHPEYGLWHGYRGAFGFSEPIVANSVGSHGDNPCAACEDRPCISHCPASALDGGRFDVLRCRAYLASPAGQGGCASAGCAARAACPVGSSYRYREEQVRFHMQALRVPAG